ncbi:MAG: adenosine kinase [Opitutales bacterium]
MNEASIDLIGVGSPLVDLLARVEDSFLATIEGEKGGMVLVGSDELGAILARVPGRIEETPGGAASNTTFASARLGLHTAFVGKVGNDPLSAYFAESFARAGGDSSRLIHGDVANGQCLSLITPDGARTMRTHLGAAATLDPAEITPEAFRGARHAHIEGYLLFNDSLMQAVLEAAKAAGCTVSLDLGSFEVVRAAGERLRGILRDHVDIVFANEDEAAALLGYEDDFEAMARALAGYCPLAALKMGARGSLVASREGALARIAPVPAAEVIDTTAAGDFWAAGFLSGWLRGKDLATCGHYGSFVAAEVVQVVGTVLPASRWPVIEAEFAR